MERQITHTLQQKIAGIISYYTSITLHYTTLILLIGKNSHLHGTILNNSESWMKHLLDNIMENCNVRRITHLNAEERNGLHNYHRDHFPLHRRSIKIDVTNIINPKRLDTDGC